jgi:hypothetical protein
MLREIIEEAAVDREVAASWVTTPPQSAKSDWRTVDRALRRIRTQRSALDADEARWLREAEAVQIWRPLGMVSMIDYLERVLGYAPRTAQDRMRVARALGDLPALAGALGSDELGFSAVRELTRVATPTTEVEWLAAARGKNLREIEELVAEHRPGDRPDDPPDPAARTHVVRFELSADTFARLRQARTVLDDEHGINRSDDGFVAALCGAVLDGAAHAEPTGRATFQIAMTVCRRCRKGWQHGGGAQIAIDAATVDRAMCDAQHIGSIDGEAPERAHQDIPPSTVRFVWRRDGGRCRVPGCRSARALEIHHLVHRSDGGGHGALNLALLCGSCHLAHHRGALVISGTAEHLEVHRPGDEAQESAARAPLQRTAAAVDAHVGADQDERVRPASPKVLDGRAFDPAVQCSGAGAHVGVVQVGRMGDEQALSKLDVAVRCTQAKAALTGLGWRPAVAHAAVAAAVAEAEGVTLERLIFEALRRCPVPKA